jgi:Fe-S cluster assembly ATP-binding protein
MEEVLLKVSNLHVKVEDKYILKGLELEVGKGEIHGILGPNGAGKSTLANTIMGNGKYKITDGKILLEGEQIQELKVEDRAKKGIFLSFQYPEEIPGITIENFLRASKGAVTGKFQSVLSFRKILEEKMRMLEIKPEVASRYLNVGFSGGEKKKNEILQMAVLEPKLAILDETDSGLDVDALKTVAEGVKALATKDNGIVVITHYEKLLEYLQPHYVHVLVDGRIVKTGGMSIAREVDEVGFESLKAV